jgi:hypothetical protein
MAALTPEQKMFIVQRLACFDTPAQCIEALKEEFSIDVPPQQVHCYHPERRQGRNMSKELRKLFDETRAKYRANTEDIPIANKTWRIETLNRLARSAEKAGNRVLTAQLLEQAAKEMGEAYTNRQKVEHTSPDGTMTPKAALDLSDLSTEDLQKIADVAAKLNSSAQQS